MSIQIRILSAISQIPDGFTYPLEDKERADKVGLVLGGNPGKIKQLPISLQKTAITIEAKKTGIIAWFKQAEVRFNSNGDETDVRTINIGSAAKRLNVYRIQLIWAKLWGELESFLKRAAQEAQESELNSILKGTPEGIAEELALLWQVNAERALTLLFNHPQAIPLAPKILSALPQELAVPFVKSIFDDFPIHIDIAAAFLRALWLVQPQEAIAIFQDSAHCFELAKAFLEVEEVKEPLKFVSTAIAQGISGKPAAALIAVLCGNDREEIACEIAKIHQRNSEQALSIKNHLPSSLF